MEIRDSYRDYIPVYTDASRDGNSVGCATVFPSILLEWCVRERAIFYQASSGRLAVFLQAGQEG